MLAMTELMGYSSEIAAERKKNPADDIISRLVAADADGDELSEIEFGYFMLLLLVAGNETTRNATSAGMVALLNHPAQWELYKRTRPETMADEIIRWASPVNVFQRTARQDSMIGGVRIKAGQRVGLFYGSANYDEDVFADPFILNIRRDPKPPFGLWRKRPALLHRRQPGAQTADDHVQHHRRPPTRHRNDRPPNANASRLDQRDHHHARALQRAVATTQTPTCTRAGDPPNISRYSHSVIAPPPATYGPV